MAIGDDRSSPGRNSAAHKRAIEPKALLCALALLVVVGVSHGQWLETTITLPDSLGGATGPSCLTTDTSERYVYIGDGSRYVFVVDAETRTRVAKLPCGVVAAVCTSTRRNKVYAADFEGNQVFAISCATNQVVATIPTGDVPIALCYNSTDDKIYTADTAGHDLTVIDCSSDVVLKTIHLEASPAELRYNPASNRVFCRVAVPGEGDELLVIDGAGDSVVAVHPGTWSSPMMVAAAVNKVYASNGSGLKALDGTTGVVLDSLNARPELMCFNSRTRKLYACDQDPAVVRVFDCAADTLVGRVWLAERYVYSLACETITSRVYFSGDAPWGDEVVEVIDGAGDTSIAQMAGPRQGILLASSKWRRMFCTDLRGPDLAVYDLDTDSLLRTIMIGGNVRAMCYDSTDDKIYYATTAVLGEVGAIDASTNQPVGHVQVGSYPQDIVWHAPTNRVYCGGNSDVTVIDPTADTVTRVLPVKWCYMLCSAPSVNKVYAVSYDSSANMELAVIDCKGETVAKTIAMPTNSGVWSMCHVSTAGYDKLYISAYGTLIIIDCIGDTFVRSYPSTPGSSFVGAGRDDKRVHFATRDAFCTFDPAGDTLVASVPWDAYGLGAPLLYIPDVDKVYCPCPILGQNCVLVADGATDSLIAQIPFYEPRLLDYDAASKHVYVACDPTHDSMITIVDSRTDSVVGSLDTHLNPAAFTMAPPHRRLYVGPFSGYIASSSMSVIRTDPPGVEDAALHGIRKPVGVTIVSRGSRLAVYQPSVLLDAAGRRVRDLRQGLHQLTACRTGVYFLRNSGDKKVVKILLVD